MASPIPTPILLEKERANGYRRRMEILHEGCVDTPHFSDLRISQLLLDELAWHVAGRVQFDTPLITVEWAVNWANSVPAPPVGLLRAAREMLQAAADDWFQSFLLADEIRAKEMVLHKRPWVDWFTEASRVAASERRRIEVILRENWPVGTQEDDAQALAQIQKGSGRCVEEAFPEIAGVSQEEWEKKVQAHREARNR